MKEINVPVMALSTDLGAAGARLRESQRSALLAKVGNEYHLFSAGNVAVGRSRGAGTLSELEPDGVLTAGHAALATTDEYALTNITSEFAVLQVRDSELAVRYASSPKDYYCDGPRHHDDFPPPPVSEGDPCPHNDGYKVVCS